MSVNPTHFGIWTILTVTACTALVILRLMDFHSAAAVAKMTASGGFLLVAATSGAFRSTYGRILFTGLILAAIGDLLLIGSGASMFMLGLGAFLLAHLVYVTAFLRRGINLRWSALSAPPIVLIAVAVSVWLTPYLTADMAIPVRSYTIVISLMVIAAFGVRGAGGPLVIPAGALLFYFSDLAVAADQFVKPEIPNYLWGLPCYYGGQLLLARSTAFSHARD